MLLENLPIIIIILSLVLCFISYVDNGDFTLFWSWASNIVYLAPILVAYRNKNYYLLYFFSLILLLSTFYHICYAYEDDACIIISHKNWVHVDVLFSWLLLYTLISYVVFKNKYRDILLLTNVLIVVMTLEADCDESNFDCQFTKIALALVYATYFAFILFSESTYKLYAAMDSLFSVIFLLAATIFYFNGSYKPSHSLWHVLGATGASFAISIYKDAEYRIIQFQKNKTKNEEGEGEPLLRRKELYYKF